MKTYKEIIDEDYMSVGGKIPKPGNKTEYQLEKMLKNVYDKYEDDFESFDDMVKKYAEDKFYKMHYIAKEYVKSNKHWK